MTTSEIGSEEIRGRVLTVIRAEVQSVPADVSPDNELATFGLNSMKAVEVLFGLEDAFGIVVDEMELEDDTFHSLGSLTEFVRERVNASRG